MHLLRTPHRRSSLFGVKPDMRYQVSPCAAHSRRARRWRAHRMTSVTGSSPRVCRGTLSTFRMAKLTWDYVRTAMPRPCDPSRRIFG